MFTRRENDVEVIYVQHDDGPGSGFSAGDEDYEIADQVAPIGKGETERKLKDTEELGEAL